MIIECSPKIAVKNRYKDPELDSFFKIFKCQKTLRIYLNHFIPVLISHNLSKVIFNFIYPIISLSTSSSLILPNEPIGNVHTYRQIWKFIHSTRNHEDWNSLSGFSLPVIFQWKRGIQSYVFFQTIKNHVDGDEIWSMNLTFDTGCFDEELVMNCFIAFTFLPTTEIFDYGPWVKAFSYTDSTKIFGSLAVGDCVPTNCYLRALGCINPYSGNVIMHPTTYALSAYQNIPRGYEEDLCVVCAYVSSQPGTTGLDGNNWKVYQKMDCSIALEATSTPLASQKHAYSPSSSKVISSGSWKDFFFNNDPRGDCAPDS